LGVCREHEEKHMKMMEEKEKRRRNGEAQSAESKLLLSHEIFRV
jgi:hypothetical protein